MSEIDLDLLGLNDTILSLESFKLRRQYMLKEMASNPIDMEPRPNRMKKPPVMSGVASNPTGYFRDLYIQDELRHMLIDKYGKIRGEKTFDGLIDAMGSRPGAFFAQGGELAAEKAGLIQTLGLTSNHDYWQYSYYEMWKQWMEQNGNAVNIETPTVTTQKPVATTPAVVHPEVLTRGQGDDTAFVDSIKRAFENLTGKGTSSAEKAKSKERVRNLNNSIPATRKMVNATREAYKLVQRAYYALEFGNYEIAKMFWDKALTLGVRESADGTFTGLDIISESMNEPVDVKMFDNLKSGLDTIIKFHSLEDYDKVLECLEVQIEQLQKIKSQI